MNENELYYGVIDRCIHEGASDAYCEEIKSQCYTIIDGGYTQVELDKLRDAVSELRSTYVDRWGEVFLKERDEYHSVRLPMSYGHEPIIELAFNDHVLALVRNMIRGSFVLNQQNLIINPPGEKYNQSAWHRDLPYQHFVSSRPLAINALFCLDEFTRDNGATFVIPASHNAEEFPSESYIKKHAIQLEAPAGSFIVMNCMTYHRGGFNNSRQERMALNHVYSIPFIKQQINIPASMDCSVFDEERQKILGVPYQVPGDVEAFLETRVKADGYGSG